MPTDLFVSPFDFKMTFYLNVEGILFLVLFIAVIYAVFRWIKQKVKSSEGRYGTPEVPEDIKELVENFKVNDFVFKIQDFDLGQYDKNGKVYIRKYKVHGGQWILKIEFHNDKLVAYSARFTSEYTRWLQRGYGDSYGITRFLYPGGD